MRTSPLRVVLWGEGSGNSAQLDCLGGASETGSFLFADARGREPSPRSLLEHARSADLCVIVTAASAGVQTETRRYAYFASLFGIRQVVLLVDQDDLAKLSPAAFASIDAEFSGFAAQLELPFIACVPVSVTTGDNIAARSAATPWYPGRTLLAVLQSIEVDERALRAPLRLRVLTPTGSQPNSREFAGLVVSGATQPGQAVRLQPLGHVSRVARIVGPDGELDWARAGQSVSLVLADELEVSRGDLVAAADDPAEVADSCEATIVWTHAAPLLRGRNYALEIGERAVTATITPIKYKLNVASLERVATSKLEADEIGVCNLQLDRAIAFDAYRKNRDTGAFLLVDPASRETVGVGLLHFALRRSKNVHWQAIDVDKAARARLKRQKPFVLWYTGLSGAGKSAIANLVDKKLHAMNRHGYLLDGDNVRHGLNKDLGFTAADRVENIRRIAEVAKLMADAGLIVSTAFISPFSAERSMARALMPPGEFVEIFVDTPLAIAEERDPKGLYRKARRGELKNFTGIDSPYEAPEKPELRIDTTVTSPEDAAELIVAFLRTRGAFDEDE